MCMWVTKLKGLVSEHEPLIVGILTVQMKLTCRAERLIVNNYAATVNQSSYIVPLKIRLNNSLLMRNKPFKQFENTAPMLYYVKDRHFIFLLH
jgi:hypothetical protein